MPKSTLQINLNFDTQKGAQKAFSITKSILKVNINFKQKQVVVKLKLVNFVWMTLNKVLDSYAF
jgi:hypothetical protein